MTVPVATNGNMPRLPSLAALTLLLVVAGLLASLSVWQWQRGETKAVLMARQAERGAYQPLSWTELRALGRDVADRPVYLEGRFDPRYRVALDNQMRQGVAGYHLHAVFRPAGASEGVLVNLGWRPTDRDGGPAVPVHLLSATRIHGWAVYPSAFLTVGEPEFTRGLWRAGRIEPAHWAGRWNMPLVPWVLRLSPDVAGGYVREWQPNADRRMGPERHRAYAFQWAMLTLAWCVCWLVGWRKWRQERV